MAAMHRWPTVLAPLALALAAAAALVVALRAGPAEVPRRVPAAGTRLAGADAGPSPLESATTTTGPGVAVPLPGSWPGFRGPAGDGVSPEPTALLGEWPADGPPLLWSVEVGEGYAGPAIHAGRVFLMDYDREAGADALRCLSLADGREIWRLSYPVEVKRNHGMSRTVPAVAGGRVVALGPMGHVSCVDMASGGLCWSVDLVREFGTDIPPWYAGQCPLIDGDRVILAPAGTPPDGPLLCALDLATGEVAWSCPNTPGWKMTHSSVAVAEVGGTRSYIYCGHRGVAGVAADDGRLLWTTGEWRISIATVPTPVPLPGGRLFLSGGYRAGSLMLRVRRDGADLADWAVEPEYRLDDATFGATQQTPILHRDHLFGVRPDGELVCLAADGTPRWTSGPANRFGLGPFLVADDKLLVMDDHGELSMVAASPAGFELLARARVLDGHDSWGPMAIAGGRLLVRDLTKMRCLDLAARNETAAGHAVGSERNSNPEGP